MKISHRPHTTKNIGHGHSGHKHTLTKGSKHVLKMKRATKITQSVLPTFKSEKVNLVVEEGQEAIS